MSQVPLGLGNSRAGAGGRKAVRIGYTDGALGSDETLQSLTALFPQARFEAVGHGWPARAAFDVLVVEIDSTSTEAVAQRLKGAPDGMRVLVILHHANLAVSRALTQAGAADVLPAPATETALALALERLLQRDGDDAAESAGKPGEVVAFLKAGGGVGATALATQTAVNLARRGADSVCLADLDLQTGAVAAYLDLPDAFTLIDVLALGHAMDQASLAGILAEHRSGARILAAAREVSPIDTVRPAQADALVNLLRREFALTLLDLPSVWTPWTLRAAALADRLVLVGRLTVPSVQLIGRQMRFLASQKLDDRSITLVCNACSPDQSASLPLKAAEKSIGRPFDVVTPADDKVMNAAVNQGVPIDEIRRGTKLEKAMTELADRVRGSVAAPVSAQPADPL